jgi:membrane protein DedA with SNARE-associated domain
VFPISIRGEGSLALAFAIVLGAFVSEDAATITAATLTATATLDPTLAFVSAFAGLWFGDLGVYALARLGGPALLRREWFQKWFAAPKPGSAIGVNDGRLGLAVSRFFPGTRLPAYLSAGFRRMPALVFAAITAVSALAWVILVFAAIQLAPSRSEAVQRHAGEAALLGLSLFIMLHLWRKWGAIARRKIAVAAMRFVKWEFWPAWLFYSPVTLFCVWLGLRYRGFALPAIANVNQKNGGIIGESKIAILEELLRTSPESIADSYLIPAGTPEERLANVQNLFEEQTLCFPFVLKPDVAQRGAGFRKIESFEQARQYLAAVSLPLILQRYAPGPKEAGIFYYRFPEDEKGHIFAITRKHFPFVVGDGHQTVRELVERDSRARLIAETYLERFATSADDVLPAGERLRLVEAGNHCQGCIFADGSDLHSDELRAAIDRISRKLPGFFIGRYDVRYESDEELRLGQGFTIVELNGAGSEATNIYDERNTLWSAYATLYRQWSLVYRIGAANRDRGYRPPSPLAVFRDWNAFAREAIQLPMSD